MKNRGRIVKPALWLLLSLLSALCMDFYIEKIWSANQPPNFSDLYAPWWGTHELLLHGRNPYTSEVAHEIQTVIYGKPGEAMYRGDPAEMAGGFAYPLYAPFLLWPTVFLRFSTVQILFLFVSILVTVGSLAMWLRAFYFRVPPVRLLTLALFTFGSFAVLQGLRLQNLSAIAAALLSAAVVLLTGEHLTLAGIFLAASTFKPQFTVVLVPWLAIWTASDWRRRQALAWSFFASMSLLIGASEWLMPGWIGHFLRIARAYRQYTFGRSILDVWFTSRGGPFAAASLLLAMLALCWQYRRHRADSPGFFLAISLVLAATVVVIPTLAPHVQLLLLPGFLCLLRYRGILWSATRSARLVLLAVWLLLAWPWAVAAGLAIAAVLFPMSALLQWWELPLYTSPLLPVVVLLALGCLIRIRSWPADQELGTGDAT